MFRIVYRIFLFILIFSPLAFGTVEQWSLTIMECLCVLSLLLLVMGLKDKNLTLYEIPGIVPLLCLWAYHIVQIVPLPPDLMKLLSPETFALYESTIGLTGHHGWMSLSINTKATVQEILRVTTYIAFYILTIQLLTKKELLRKTISIVVILSFVMAFQGILQHLINNHKIFWLREIPGGGDPFGPFVNKNNYAGFMEMLFPIAFSAFLAYKPRGNHGSLSQKLLEVVSERNKFCLFFGFASVLIAISIFLTFSRGAILSWIVSTMILGCMVILSRQNYKSGMIILAVFTVIIISFGWFGWKPIINKFETVNNVGSAVADERIKIWKDTVDIIKDFPLTGTGFGSFVSIYPKYQTHITDHSIDHVHNDYIELLTDGGIIAFVFTSWFLLEIFIKSFKSFRFRRETYSIYLYLGSITGIIAILIHSITDFNLHIASNGLYFSFLSALAVSTANTRLRDSMYVTYLKPLNFTTKRMVIVAVTLILFITLTLNVGSIVGNFVFSLTKNSKLNAETDRKQILIVRDVISKASLFDPLDASYYYKKADTEMLMSNFNGAMPLYLRALKLDPVNGEYLQRTGQVYANANNLETAEKLMQAGVAYDKLNPERYKTYASWLLNQNRKRDAMSNIIIAISLFPDMTTEYLTLMLQNGLNNEEILSVLPPRVAPYIAFGDYLCNIGNEIEAEEIYNRAVGFMSNENEIKPIWFYKVYQYYTTKGLNEKALDIMQQAKIYLPKDVGVGFNIATLAEQLGMRNRAIQEYRNVLILDPKNIDVRRRLAKLLASPEMAN